METKRKCAAKDQQISDDGNKNKKRSKKRCIEKNQQTSDDGVKDQLAKKAKSSMPVGPERIDMEKVCVKEKEASDLDWCDITKFKCESSIGHSYGNHLFTQSDYEKILLKYGNSIKELSLSNNCDSSVMPFVGDHCKNLTSLECEFGVDSLNNNTDHFVQAFTQLNELKCIKIIVTEKYSHETMNLFEIINSLPEEINEIHILTKFWFKPVFLTFEKFKNLQKLNLSGICLDELVLQEIAESTTFVYLNIEFSYKHIGFPLFNKLVNLEYIQIKIQKEFDDHSDRMELSTKVLSTIFDKCKNLKHLDVTCQYYNFAEIPLDKWKNLKNLEYLTLRCDEIPVDLADTIVKYCKNLKHLWITQEWYLISAKIIKKLTKLENLESLVIDRKRFQLSEKSIIIIANNCKKLKRLEFRYNGYIIPTGVDDKLSSPSVLNELSKLQYLEHLNFEGLENVDDSTIIAIANNCKNLQSLDIQYCGGISETALVPLTKLENLQILKLSCCYDISDSLIIRLKGLKELDCCSCEKLTDAGIIQVIKNNPDLEKINVCSIDNITIDMVIAADEATKNRSNGIVLHIITDNSSILESSKSIIKSQWLVVKRWDS